MLAKLPTLAIASLALLLTACPSESDAAAPDEGESTTSPEAEEIDKAAEDAAEQIDEENADEELDKLKQELDEDE